MLTPEEEERVHRCAKLKGCEMLDCMGLPSPCVNGQPHPSATQQEPAWDIAQPSRGLGDLLTKFTHATGIAALANYLFPKTPENPKGCGCHGDQGRQGTLNRWLPFHH